MSFSISGNAKNKPLQKTVLLIGSYKAKCSITVWSRCAGMSEKLMSTKSCAQIFIAALFIIAEHWNQLRCLTNGEWLNQLWCIHTMEYYSATKRNRSLTHNLQQLDWISRALWGVNEDKPKKLHTVWFHLYNILKMTIEMKSRLEICQRLGMVFLIFMATL